MRLSTWDLHNISICSKKWLESPAIREDETSLVRDLLKRMVLTDSLGRSHDWNFKSIANIWDEIFWSGKEVSRENIDSSVKGIVAAKKLYDRLPRGEFEALSTLELTHPVDSSVELFSSGDFVLIHPDRIETWVYGPWSQKEIRRSVIPAAEHFLVQKKVRALHQRPFYIVVYRATMRGIAPGYFMIQSSAPEAGNENLVVHLCNIARRKISIPTLCELCQKCEVNC